MVDMTSEQETLKSHYARYREILANMTLMSDAFMRNVFIIQDCAEYVLQIILQRNDFQIIDIITQKDLKNLHGRSIMVDFIARCTDGSLLSIEVQQENEGASPERARYTSGMMDMNILDPGKDFKDLPESFTIFITRNDVLQKGLPIYHIERVIRETGDDFGDRAHIIYVNARIQDDTELGRLMHDFHCKKADDMYSNVLADRVRMLKETPKGVDDMCRELEQLYLDGKNEGIEQGIEKGIERGTVLTTLSNIRNLMETLGLTIDAAMSALKVPEKERQTYTNLLASE